MFSKRRTLNNLVNRALTTSLHPAADFITVVEGGVAVMATVLKTLGVVAWAIIVVGYFYPRAMPLPLSPDALAVVGAILIGASASR
jgi:hypothetical protein